MDVQRTILVAAGLLLAGALTAQRVQNAEYFWDTDPGAGNALPMTAADGAFDKAVEAILLNTTTLPAVGTHVLGVRVQGRANAWGPVFRTTIVIEAPLATVPDIELTQAEFFWDTDPGEGNGTPMLAFDGDFNAALEAIALETTDLPATGTHVLNIRSHEAQGGWSVPFWVVVEVLGGTVTFPEIRVTEAEYYLNTDPGAGNGMPMLAVDGDYSAALEQIKGGNIPVPVAAGINVLWLRARDAEEVWGPSFGVVVNIDTTITGTVAVPELDNGPGMSLLPNPATATEGFSLLFTTVAEAGRVQVIDARGSLVYDHAFAPALRLEVPLTGAAPGVYSVAVQQGEHMHWLRLVVQ